MGNENLCRDVDSGGSDTMTLIKFDSARVNPCRRRISNLKGNRLASRYAALRNIKMGSHAPR